MSESGKMTILNQPAPALGCLELNRLQEVAGVEGMMSV